MKFFDTRLGDLLFEDRNVVDPNSSEAKELPYLSLEDIASGSGKITMSAAQLGDVGKSMTFRFDERHILYGKLRPYLNKVALPNFTGRCTTELIPLLPKDGVSREYLAFLLRTSKVVEAAMRQKTGARMPRADIRNLFKLDVTVPSFLSDQQQIAKELEIQLAAVDRARAATEERLSAAKRLAVAYVREVFESQAASTWPRVPLGDVCFGRAQYGLSEKSNGDVLGIPILGMVNIYGGLIVWDNLRHITVSDEDKEKYLLHRGDILFNRTNSAELVGKAAVFEDDREAVFASYLVRFRLKTYVADPHFVTFYINSSTGRRFIESKMARAIGQVNINPGIMLKMPIPLPDLPTQQNLGATLRERLFTVRRLEQSSEDELTSINNLSGALLREAFEVAE